MEPADLNPSDDQSLDEMLRRASTESPLPDDGFSQRVLAALPPRPKRSSGAVRRVILCTVAAIAGVAVVGRLPNLSGIAAMTQSALGSVQVSVLEACLALAALALGAALISVRKLLRGAF